MKILQQREVFVLKTAKRLAKIDGFWLEFSSFLIQKFLLIKTFPPYRKKYVVIVSQTEAA
jgi:hypothetical protein